jgi:hypothetical protein
MKTRIKEMNRDLLTLQSLAVTLRYASSFNLYPANVEYMPAPLGLPSKCVHRDMT